ncbi:MAG: hypothetical protein ABIQ13_00330 [Pedococcus sp.]
MSLETQLREALAARADDLVAPAFDPCERVTSAVVTSRRRRRVAAVGAAAAVVAVAVLAPNLAQGEHRSTLPAKRTQVIVPGPNDPRWSALSSWPTRGSLATDTAFLTAVGNQFATSHVLYAADLPTTRVVVSWDAETGGDGKLTMFSGPRGGTAQDLAEVSSASGGLDDVVSLREHADNDATIVVLTRPGIQTASISRSVQIGVDGSVTRDAYRPVRLTDGVYSELLQDSPPSLTRVRVGDSTTAGSRVTLMASSSRPADTDGPSICLDCTGEDFRARAEPAIGGGVAVSLGLSPDDVTTTTRYYGPVDRALAGRVGMADSVAPGTATRLMVTDTRLPQGQVLRSALLVATAKDGSAASTMELATGVPINAATANVHPFVLHSGGTGTTTMSYEVFALDAAKARLVSSSPSIYPSTTMLTPREGRVVATTPFWSPDTTPYEIEAYDGSGTPLGRWPVDLPSEDAWTEGVQP